MRLLQVLRRIGCGLAQRRERGAFDPVSIIAGITIIGMLSGAAYAYWPAATSNSKTAGCEANLDTISQAAELYYAANSTHGYPPDGSVTIARFTTDKGLQELPSVPVDPAGGVAYTIQTDTSGARPIYTITCPGSHAAISLQGYPGWTATSQTLFRSMGQTYTAASLNPGERSQ